MGFLTSIQVLVYIFISFFTGSLLISAALEHADLNVLATHVHLYLSSGANARLVVLLLGFLLILLCLRYIQSVITVNEKIIYSPQGKISITLSALEDIIKKTLEEKKEISQVKPRIILHKRSVEVLIKANLAAEINLIDLADEIQDKIKNKLIRILGEKETITVKIKIKKLVTSSRAFDDAEPETPFRNYNYQNF